MMKGYILIKLDHKDKFDDEESNELLFKQLTLALGKDQISGWEIIVAHIEYLWQDFANEKEPTVFVWFENTVEPMLEGVLAKRLAEDAIDAAFANDGDYDKAESERLVRVARLMSLDDNRYYLFCEGTVRML